MRIPKDGDIYYWKGENSTLREDDRIFVKKIGDELKWCRILNSRDLPTNYPNLLRDYDIENLNRLWGRKNAEIIKKRLGIK